MAASGNESVVHCASPLTRALSEVSGIPLMPRKCNNAIDLAARDPDGNSPGVRVRTSDGRLFAFCNEGCYKRFVLHRCAQLPWKMEHDDRCGGQHCERALAQQEWFEEQD